MKTVALVVPGPGFFSELESLGRRWAWGGGMCVCGGEWIVVVEKGAIYDFICPHLARAV